MENQITKIKKYKTKVAIYINGKRFDFHPDVLGMFYLYENKNLSAKEKKELFETNDSIALLKYATSLLKKAPYTEWRIREKLYLKKNDKHLIDSVVNKLKDAHLINDKDFVKEHVEYFNELNYGKNKIIQKLKDKGVFDEQIAKINFSSENEFKKALNVLPQLEKKYIKYNNEQKKQHIYNALILKGFDSGVAASLLTKVKSSSKQDEIEKLKKDYKTARIRLERKYDGELLKKMIFNQLRSKGYHYNDIIKVCEDYDL